MRCSWRSVARIAQLALAGCGGDNGTGPPPACTGMVDVVTTRERRPLITWTPNCTVARLQIVAPPVIGQPEAEAWDIRGGPTGIASGVRYGVLPNGATEEAPAYPGNFNIYVTVFDAAGRRLGGAPISSQ